MKKLVSAAFVGALVLTGCANKTTSSAPASSVVMDDPGVKSEGVMTYAEYVQTGVNKEVTIEAYVQAKQGWWEKDGVGVATVYTQDADGAYFLYDMPISEEDYQKLVEGQKIKVTGYKSEWSGEVEIIDATYELEYGNYVVAPVDVTDQLGEDSLIDYQNQKVAFKGLEVVASDDNDAAYLYKYDGSGTEGDDLYFKVSDGENTYTFTVESYLTGPDTEVYKAVKALEVGDEIDAEGFLYWYEGANPHIISVKVK